MAALSLSPEAAYEALAAFARRCGRGPLELAMHAAVPDGFRLDMLPLLRRNFLPRLSTDASADADLLLAPFCEHLGNNYFQLDPETRRLLLDQLAVAYGDEAKPRLPRIAAFLLAYVERAERRVRGSEDRVLRAYLEIQRWNALGFRDPPAAARALAEAIQGTAPGAGAARVRLGTVAAVLNLPLGPYYRRFIEYTLGVDALFRGDQQQARDWLASFEQETPQIEGVKLKSLEELMPSAPEHTGTSKAERERPQITTIYLSSTYEDLKEHRQAVFDALQSSGYQVIGMEDYVARDDRPVAACLADVERADLYVGLFAFRYGYIPPAEQGNPDGLSITELELRRANASPTTHCLVFLLNADETPWPQQYFDAGDQGARMRALREELSRESVVSFFRSPQELATMVLSAVSKHLRTTGKPSSPSTDETERLLRELEDFEMPHQRRAEIGDRLAELGDPRSGTGVGPSSTPDIDWVAIPAGEIELEGTTGKANVAPFHMSRYLVTNAQFQAFAETTDGYANADWWKDMSPGANTGSQKPGWGQPNRPRETVSWFEAVVFCRWLSGRLGFEVRLPDEYEWQRAATGGDPSHVYPWGWAWDDRRCNTGECWLMRTTAVGLYPAGASTQGVLDLSGNLWEWCSSKYREPRNTVIDDSNESRVVRGGSWDDDRAFARCASRFDYGPDYRLNYIGFRVVCSSPIE